MAASLVGSVLAGKYRVDNVLGQGGMGIVLAATHIELHERVAIKILHAAASTSSAHVARFLREGRASAQLRSEHVVRVRDVGRLDDGSPFMVMERLDGMDLGELPRPPAPGRGRAPRAWGRRVAPPLYRLASATASRASALLAPAGTAAGLCPGGARVAPAAVLL